jgi:GNAT superfamily N-acetyltransferase
MIANIYIATVNDVLAGFCSVMHFPHPNSKNIKKIHRLVVLPDCQGVGVGKVLINEVASMYVESGNRVRVVTSNPMLITALKSSKQWLLKHHGRMSAHNDPSKKGLKEYSSNSRITTSWEFKK